MNMMSEPEKIVGYVRASTLDPAGCRASIDGQTALIKADAEAKDQVVVRIFMDVGQSGVDARRPGFNRMLEFVENPANGICEIKIVSLSRLTRNLRCQIKTSARLKRANVRLHALSHGPAGGTSVGLHCAIMALFDEHFT